MSDSCERNLASCRPAINRNDQPALGSSYLWSCRYQYYLKGYEGDMHFLCPTSLFSAAMMDAAFWFCTEGDLQQIFNLEAANN